MDTSQLEYSVIGAICIEPKICDKISGILSPDDFSISACSEVFEAACDALSRGKHFDAVLARRRYPKPRGRCSQLHPRVRLRDAYRVKCRRPRQTAPPTRRRSAVQAGGAGGFGG
ncbi:MAG: DnaB-like helicase N-terminal domain-containing protein [Oscillospiraceae bacterium]